MEFTESQQGNMGELHTLVGSGPQEQMQSSELQPQPTSSASTAPLLSGGPQYLPGANPSAQSRSNFVPTHNLIGPPINSYLNNDLLGFSTPPPHLGNALSDTQIYRQQNSAIQSVPVVDNSMNSDLGRFMMRSHEEILGRLGELTEVKVGLGQLTGRTASLETRMTRLERKRGVALPASEISISGIPLDVSLPSMEIVARIFTVLGISNPYQGFFDAREIQRKSSAGPNSNSGQAILSTSGASSHTESRNRPPTKVIFVTMTNRNALIRVLVSKKNKGKLSSAEIFQSSAPSFIYINEILPQDVHTILKEVRLAARDAGFQNPWARFINGEYIIFTKRNPDDPLVEIRSMEDLSQLTRLDT